MKTFDIDHAKTHLSRLVEGAAKGEAFMIAKAGRPLVKVVPLEGPLTPAPEPIGFLKGQILVPDDFDRMFEEEIAEMFGAK